MVVGFRIDFLFYQIGHGDLLHSFFSTISYQKEDRGRWYRLDKKSMWYDLQGVV